HRCDRKPGRQRGRQILGRMDPEIDDPCEERVIDLLGEQPFSTRLRKWAVADRVPCRTDHVELDPIHGDCVNSRQAPTDLIRLRERERTTASPNTQKHARGVGLTRCYGLQPVTSHCYPPPRPD